MPGLVSKMLGFGTDKRLKTYRQVLAAVEDWSERLAGMDDCSLTSEANGLRERATAGEALDALLPEAFALAREAAGRALGMRHYDEQLMGAMALHDGCVAEMATGEGKTLAATAAAFLDALSGEPLHIATANDYLAERDCAWMGPVFRLLGMDAAFVRSGMLPGQRRAAYAAQVVYGTGSEFGFDYLRDNMVQAPSSRVQRGLGVIIVDEADSVLIDGARTPLVITGSGSRDGALYRKFAEIVETLDPEADVFIDAKTKSAYATDAGLDKVEEVLGREVYADASGLLANHLRQALRARFVLNRDVDYVVRGGEVLLVDELTGRIMEGRRYVEGLHQAVEAREGLEVEGETLSLASVTVQNFFKLYSKLSGMTGTARTEEAEFKKVYGLDAVRIPTHKPLARVDLPDYVFRTEEAKFLAIASEVERLYAQGRPVLVGTTSVKESAKLGALLEERGVPYRRLDAVDHAREAAIIARAGCKGAVTIAANMAGRGTDIMLGGNPELILKERLAAVAAEWGSVPDWKADKTAKAVARQVRREGHVIRRKGGLAVIGAGRHDSRRIDEQLRGRAGRQGDPGETRFFVSLEDSLLTRFGGERLRAVSEMMQKRGLGDKTPLEDEVAAKVLDACQREMESAHLAQRKYLTDFDEPLNEQRLAVYAERNAVLDGKDVWSLLPSAALEASEAAVASYCAAIDASDDWDMEALVAWAADMSGCDASFLREVDHDEDPESLVGAMSSFFGEILEEKKSTAGDDGAKLITRVLMLKVLDAKWLAHLQEMESLRQGISLRAVGRRDPLLEFKEESYQAFENMTRSVYEEWLRMVMRTDPSIFAFSGNGPHDESVRARKDLA